MAYFWTTMENNGKNITITEGGHYEAIEGRYSSYPSVKMSNGIVPSSDIPELCVSGSPEASLFAKIQSAQKDGTYYIYRTDKKPDIKLEGSLDFDELEEHRFNMNKHDSVKLRLYASVKIPMRVVEDIQDAYTYAEANGVNFRYARDIKSHLRGLLNGNNYPQNALKQAKIDEFEDFANHYGVNMAKKLYGEIPDGYEK